MSTRKGALQDAHSQVSDVAFHMHQRGHPLLVQPALNTPKTAARTEINQSEPLHEAHYNQVDHNLVWTRPQKTVRSVFCNFTGTALCTGNWTTTATLFRTSWSQLQLEY